LLDNAYISGVSDLNKLMGSAVMTYEAKFKSPAEEFNYEMSRYHSFEELVPIALEQLKPSEGSIKISDRYVQASRTARDTAKQQAASGDYQTAIATLQEAVKQLQTALKTLGLSVPQ